MWQKMGSLIDRYSRLGISRQKKTLPRLYDFGEAFEIDLSHEFQLYTFAQPRSSSDNFSLTLQLYKESWKSNTTHSEVLQVSHIYFFPLENLIDFSPPGSHYLLNITVGIPDMTMMIWLCTLLEKLKLCPKIEFSEKLTKLWIWIFVPKINQLLWLWNVDYY